MPVCAPGARSAVQRFISLPSIPARSVLRSSRQRRQRPQAALFCAEARLRRMSPQAAMLSKHALAQGHTRRQRGCSRSCAFLHRYAGVREITRRAQEGRDAFCAPEDPSSIRAHAPAGALRCARRVPPRSHCAEPEDAGKARLAAEASRTDGLSCMRGCGVHPCINGGTPQPKPLMPPQGSR